MSGDMQSRATPRAVLPYNANLPPSLAKLVRSAMADPYTASDDLLTLADWLEPVAQAYDREAAHAEHEAGSLLPPARIVEYGRASAAAVRECVKALRDAAPAYANAPRLASRGTVVELHA